MSDKSVELKTNLYENGVIAQEVQSFENGKTQTIAAWSMDTKEPFIRDALIRLGWTPPSK